MVVSKKGILLGSLLLCSLPAMAYEVSVEAGANLYAIKYNEVKEDPSHDFSSVKGSVHAGIGVSRAFSDKHHLGIRLDVDRYDGNWFYGLRALDYQYAFSSRWRAGAFIGAASYDYRLPAYGLYYGATLERRNFLTENLSLVLDVKSGDTLTRNRRTEEGDRPSERPDIFVDILSGGISLRYHF